MVCRQLYLRKYDKLLNYLTFYFRKENSHINYSSYNTSLQNACVSLLNRWKQWDGTGEPFKKSDLAEFQTTQTIQFLALLLKSNGYTLQKIKSMQDVYNFNCNGNREILFRYK